VGFANSGTSFAARAALFHDDRLTRAICAARLREMIADIARDRRDRKSKISPLMDTDDTESDLESPGLNGVSLTNRF
jgi:hypothetical protein